MTYVKKSTLVATVGTCALLLGCATSEKIQVVQAGDHNLSCSGLKDEIARLDRSQSDIDSKKGMTGTNVAAALFWLPGLAYTYYDAGEAQRLITDRKSALTKSYNDKKCN